MNYQEKILWQCRENLFSNVKTDTHVENFEGAFIDPKLKQIIKIITS